MASVVEYGEYLEFAVGLAKEAGVLIRNSFFKEKQIESKQCSIDLVTEVDQQCEKLIMNAINKKYPTHLFIGEETTASGVEVTLTDAPTWIVDPIDGTTNFIHRFPATCVSIGLAINKDVVVGVVYNPILEELFTAAKGSGAFLNSRRIHVSTTEDIDKAVISSNVGYVRQENLVDQMLGNIKALCLKNVRAIRMTGSAALAMCDVACGRADTFYEWGIHSWDIAAGKILIEEAGGEVIDGDGTPLKLLGRSVLAGNKKLNAEVVKTIRPPNPLPQGV